MDFTTRYFVNMKNQKTFPELVFAVLINEIEPRQKKFGVTIPAAIAGSIVKMEHTGIITRKETRLLLDHLFEAEKKEKENV